MTGSVTESWERIEAWLARYAPLTYEALEPAAEPAEIAAAEEVMGHPFPGALRESLLRHDGTGYRVLLPSMWMLLGTRHIADAWQLRREIYGEGAAEDEEGDPGGEYGPWWHAQWVPFAADGGGDYLVIDQREHRRRGRLGRADHETGCWFVPHLMWGSLPALLEATATAMEAGREVDGYLPVVTDEGELEWEF
ncbi:SMI1/KNR4 family protein [Streptomyces sp. NPDC051561]|uniref:SMI1/KNR4 family protein n=1 Tax=Streptomyces sp. NPDC051561 TaxID=3365658 RepID=UPI00379A30F5